MHRDEQEEEDRDLAMEETPEFRKAVTQAAAAALGEMIPKIIAELTVARGGQAQPEDAHWAEKLSMSIAQLTDPGRQLIPPEIVAARAAAAARLRQLLVDARAAGEMPVYRLLAKVQLPIEGCGETLIDPLQRNQETNRVYPTRIRWPLVPNLAMEPTDEWSEKIMAAFRETIGNSLPQSIEGKPVPPSGGYLDSELAMTPMGHVVGGTAAGLVRSRDREAPAQSRFGLIVGEDGQRVLPNAGGPPFTDVHVLGTIVPPARQNG